MSTWSLRDLLAYVDRVEPVIDRLSHFELLDIPGDASIDRVQDAFHVMAARLHPDLYRTELSPRDFERLTIVYARIAEAYRALRTSTDREQYLREAARDMEEGKAPAASRADAAALLGPKAAKLYRRAMSALRTGDRASAALNLKMALALEPNSAVIREALADLKKKA